MSMAAGAPPDSQPEVRYTPHRRSPNGAARAWRSTRPMGSMRRQQFPLLPARAWHPCTEGTSALPPWGKRDEADKLPASSLLAVERRGVGCTGAREPMRPWKLLGHHWAVNTPLNVSEGWLTAKGACGRAPGRDTGLMCTHMRCNAWGRAHTCTHVHSRPRPPAFSLFSMLARGLLQPWAIRDATSGAPGIPLRRTPANLLKKTNPPPPQFAVCSCFKSKSWDSSSSPRTSQLWACPYQPHQQPVPAPPPRSRRGPYTWGGSSPQAAPPEASPDSTGGGRVSTNVTAPLAGFPRGRQKAGPSVPKEKSRLRTYFLTPRKQERTPMSPGLLTPCQRQAQEPWMSPKGDCSNLKRDSTRPRQACEPSAVEPAPCWPPHCPSQTVPGKP